MAQSQMTKHPLRKPHTLQSPPLLQHLPLPFCLCVCERESDVSLSWKTLFALELQKIKCTPSQKRSSAPNFCYFKGFRNP